MAPIVRQKSHADYEALNTELAAFMQLLDLKFCAWGGRFVAACGDKQSWSDTPLEALAELMKAVTKPPEAT